ncbi:hypothetical protein AcW1_002483 [Taiwanofungus camphoratus]|nr:hypothetical protein AcV7_005456 [Antrodia cinnamomea]KAI0943274.1 hypothetical protein AcW1_002483 [Antrodia cinnamomea]
MVFVGDKKYACETCIKGHRSSSCKHTDRPLYEIKKKGRPVTQCEHCRELRKTKQVHVKCMCGVREVGVGSLNRGSAKVFTSAAFPSGLPEALEASVALQVLSDGSDSDHSSHISSGPCTCKDSGSCTCCTPRAPRIKRQGKDREHRRSERDKKSPDNMDVEGQIVRPAGLVANAHVGDYRPVLPRPPPEQQPSPNGSIHDPSSVDVRVPSPRHQSHGQMFYSPYSRAYEYTHGSEHSPKAANAGPFQPSLTDMNTSVNYAEQTGSIPNSISSWLPTLGASVSAGSTMSSVLCGCGPSCACPGCIEHRGHNADTSASCINPSTCASCLDCAMLSLPTSLPPDSQSRYGFSQNQSIDDWIREVSSMAASPDSMPQLPFSNMPGRDQGPNQAQSAQLQVSSQSDVRFDPRMLQTYALWSNLQEGQIQGHPAQAAPEECCGGRCKCPAGMCACLADCCGCCQGCQCPGHEHQENSDGRLTFAVSGERAPCCNGGRRGDDSMPVASRSNIRIDNAVGGSKDGGEDVVWNDEPLSIPHASLSRASSFSSGSSSHHSPMSIASTHLNVTVTGPVQSCCGSSG